MRDCRVWESEGESGGWSEGPYETGKNREGAKQESLKFGGEREREREEWEQGKLEAILDTGCRGNLCRSWMKWKECRVSLTKPVLVTFLSLGFFIIKNTSLDPTGKAYNAMSSRSTA